MPDSIPRPAPHDPLLGAVVDEKYVIERVIGSGGMATVYAATRRQIGDLVAVKILTPESSALPMALARFQREARAAARIRHPNVVAIYDFGTLADERAYIVMEYVPGGSLREELDALTKIAPERAVAIMRCVCAAMHAAHEADIVHRDLKPENIMLADAADSESVKIVDFGVADLREITAVSSLTKLTEHGLTVGTPHYMSPEQCRSDPVDRRADIYSLSVILYEMLTGAVPFNGRTAAAVIIQQAVDPPRNPCDLNSDIPPALGEAILRGLEKDPDRRPADALHFARELDAALASPGPISPARVAGASAEVADEPSVVVLPDSSPNLHASLRTDALTGLYNFAFLKEKIEDAVLQRSSVALFRLEVTLRAHDTGEERPLGDAALREVAAWLRNFVRERGVVARTADGEFGVLAPDLSAEEARLYGEQSLVALSRHAFAPEIVPDGFFLSASVGVAGAPSDGDTAAALLHASEQALSDAGRRGGFAQYLGGRESGEFAPNFNVFAGRETELARLLDSFEQAAVGRGRPVFIIGSGGMGKTRLMQEFRRRLAEKNVRVATVSCAESQDASPYRPFYNSLYGPIRAILDSPTPGFAQSVFGPLLERVQLDFSAPERADDFSARLHSGALRNRQTALEYLTSLHLHLAAVQPLAVWAEDVAQASEPCLEALGHLARFAPGNRLLLCVATHLEGVSDAHPLRSWMRALKQSLDAEMLPLAPLSQADAGRLTHAIFRKLRMSSETLAHLHQATNGAPRFMCEMLRFLTQTGHIHLLRGEWRFPPLTDFPLPPALADAAETALAALAPATQEILALASVIGEAFTFDLLQETTERSESELLLAVEDGLAHGMLLEEITDGDEDAYRLRCAIAQKVLYGRLHRRRKRSMHLRVGQSLEKRLSASGHDGRFVKRLAEHFHAAGEYAAVLKYAVAAGAQAWRTGAIAEAAKFYGWATEAEEKLNLLVDILFDNKPAAEAAPPPDQLRSLFDLNLQYGALLTHVGDLPQAEKKLRMAETLSQFFNEERLRGRLFLTLAEFWDARAEYRSALTYCQQAAGIFSATGDKRAESRALTVAAPLHARLGNVPDADAACEKAASIARAIKDRAAESLALQHIASLQLWRGRFAEAANKLHEAVAAARAVADAAAEFAARLGLVRVLRFQGEHEAARTLCEHLLTQATDAQNVRGEAAVRVDLSNICRAAGDFSDGMEYGRAALEIARTVGDRRLEALALLSIGRIHRSRRESALATQCFQFAHVMLEQTREGVLESQALIDLAEAALDSEQHENALRFAERALEFATDDGLLALRWRAHFAAGLALQSLNRRREAHAALTDALAIIYALEQNLSREADPKRFWDRVAAPVQAAFVAISRLIKKDDPLPALEQI